MGSNGTRVIKINNLEQQYEHCEKMSTYCCPIYGQCEHVMFRGMEFNIAQSVLSQEVPHRVSLHYLIQPRILIFPDFNLLEELSPQNKEELLMIVKGIAEMGIEGGQIGVGNERIAYSNRWGVVGEKDPLWPYYQVFKENDITGVFFSPQQMLNLSQNRRIPKYDIQKSDVFSLGIMLIEKIFQEDLSHIYDYENYEIRLNPVLEKLVRIRSEWGEEYIKMFIGMIEIEEEDRFSFEELLEITEQILQMEQSSNKYMMGSNRMRMSNRSNNRTPTRQNQPGTSIYNNKTPRNDKNDNVKYRNDVSPFRGRFGSNVKSNRKTPEKVGGGNRSPMRRNLVINTGMGGRAPSQRGLSPLNRKVY